MKIGISDGRTWKDQHYLKLKSFGFDFYDFKMSDTTALPYTNDDNEFEKYLKNEKSLPMKQELRYGRFTDRGDFLPVT